MQILTTLLMKDQRLLRRDKRGVVSVFFFTALVSLILFFGLGSLKIEKGIVLPIIIWLSTFFGGTLQLNRTFDYEREESVMEGLKMLPNVMSNIYLSKFIINTIALFTVLIFATFFSCILFNYSENFSFLLPISLGALGMSAIGTTFSSMVMSHHKKDIILPTLLYPLMVPIVIAVIKAMSATVVDNLPWLKIIIAFDVVYVTASYMMFESIVEE